MNFMSFFFLPHINVTQTLPLKPSVNKRVPFLSCKILIFGKKKPISPLEVRKTHRGPTPCQVFYVENTQTIMQNCMFD